MNGCSLLFALASLGITAQMEHGPNGQPSYTIRIESMLLDELRQGEAIKTNVAVGDRPLRRFRILVSPEPNLRGGATQRGVGDYGGRAESLVEYEAVLLENNEVEMWVQIAPERVETLAAGKAIEGEVPAEVREIHRFRIFVGVNLLPRQQGMAATPDSPPYLLPGADRNLTPAAADDRGAFHQPRLGAPPINASPSSGGSLLDARTGPPGSAGTSGNFSSGGGGLGLGQPPAGDFRTAWRNGPDQSTVMPPPNDRFTGANSVGAYPPATNAMTSENRFAPPATNRFDSPPYTSPPPYSDRNAPLGYGTNPGAQFPSGYPTNPTPPAYAAPQTMIASRPETPPATAPGTAAPPNTNWVPTHLPVNSSPIAAATQPTTSATRPSEEPSSSVPLILTTLALFTSLGVNTYLGWLAWSFFWRYRDAVNESVRARSYSAAGRQAA